MFNYLRWKVNYTCYKAFFIKHKYCLNADSTAEIAWKPAGPYARSIRITKQHQEFCETDKIPNIVMNTRDSLLHMHYKMTSLTFSVRREGALLFFSIFLWRR